jgi:hypothetical protein
MGTLHIAAMKRIPMVRKQREIDRAQKKNEIAISRYQRTFEVIALAISNASNPQDGNQDPVSLGRPHMQVDATWDMR